MPNVTDGCIVEWEYRLTSPYRSIDKVELQYQIPIKKIQCEIEIPQYYFYNVKHTGYVQINATSDTKNNRITKTVAKNVYKGNGVYSSQVTDYTSNITIINNERPLHGKFLQKKTKKYG